jgi:hypothetical protein
MKCPYNVVFGQWASREVGWGWGGVEGMGLADTYCAITVKLGSITQGLAVWNILSKRWKQHVEFEM